MKQTLSDGTIQYRKAWIDMYTGKLYTFGEDSITAPNRIIEDLYYYDCVEKRPDQDGYYESHWATQQTLTVEETA